ncbi:DEAH-box RNA helicase prp16, partial [Perkinsus olseni]
DIASPTLTAKGRRMAQYPLEPLVSNILVTEEIRTQEGGGDEGRNCLAEILTLVSMLSTDNIFLSSGNIKHNNTSTAWFTGLNTRQQQHHLSSSSPQDTSASSKGDHVCLVELYNTWKTIPSSSVLMWCNKRDISHNALLKAKSIRAQVKDILNNTNTPSATKKSGCIIDTCGSDWSILRHAICRGMWTNTYQRVADTTTTTNNSSPTLAGVWYSP